MNQSMPWPMSLGLQLSSFGATLASSCALWWLPFPVLCFCFSPWELSLALCEAGDLTFLGSTLSSWEMGVSEYILLLSILWGDTSDLLGSSESPQCDWAPLAYGNSPCLIHLFWFFSPCLTSPIPPVVVPEISSHINYLCSNLSLLRTYLFSKSM